MSFLVTIENLSDIWSLYLKHNVHPNVLKIFLCSVFIGTCAKLISFIHLDAILKCFLNDILKINVQYTSLKTMIVAYSHMWNPPLWLNICNYPWFFWNLTLRSFVFCFIITLLFDKNPYFLCTCCWHEYKSRLMII